jgi:endonuclease/exonuclease/phosphatase family metal-dependent hydrolase
MTDHAGRVRLMTWNLWWRFGPAWRERQPAIVETLRATDPDVVGLQEAWGAEGTSQAHELAGQLGLHAAFATPGLPPTPVPVEHEDQVGVEMGVGLLSRWPITRAEAVAMPARHRSPAPVALRSTIEHPDGPLHVVVAATEWEPAYNDDRRASSERLVELAFDPAYDGSLPVVVMGDLNAAPDDPVLRPLQDLMVDAWTAGGGDPSAVTLPSSHPHAPVEAEHLIDRRIDHVFLRPGQPDLVLEAESARDVGDPIGGVIPSDHRAVVCDVSWRRRR